MWPVVVRPREHVTRRAAQRLRPEDRRSVENEVVLRPRINGRRPVLRGFAAPPGRAFRDHLETGDVRGITVILPAHQPGNATALLHSRALKHPVTWLGHNPVSAA